MKISISDAAKMVNVQRSTLYRKNKKGELSFEEDVSGDSVIDISELMRIYPNVKELDQSAQQAQQLDMKQKLHYATVNETNLLQQEIKFLREKITDQEKQLSESRDREKDYSEKLDKAQSVIERQTHLIENKSSEAEIKPPETRKKFLGIF